MKIKELEEELPNGFQDAMVSSYTFLEEEHRVEVFVMGHSSGGMATNILLGSYPDMFKALNCLCSQRSAA